MSARSSRWRAQRQFERDLSSWMQHAINVCHKSKWNEDLDAWHKLTTNVEWMRDRMRRPNLAPIAHRCATRTVLVPWSVYKRLERQATAWQNARVKRKEQIRRMKK